MVKILFCMYCMVESMQVSGGNNVKKCPAELLHQNIIKHTKFNTLGMIQF